MGSKTVSLKDETYRRLNREKRDGESFSDAIDRLLVEDDTNPLRELIGLVDEDELENVRTRSNEFREDVNNRFGSGERADEDQ
ncbi:antitoxin VapB family protein [Natronorubrum texcoconense]|uniref:Predicted antitoxin, CopG family n=1 Tax=Natronorubrum texcoconense TaxID=1095776 RepID=A0A1G8U1A1_9EURY|nr:antitoxin VapB family protein [Natronorubrum texcoconense]SDJ47513.1 Predicted antitoxin, CopG family [Natronorubrum texcoconense]